MAKNKRPFSSFLENPDTNKAVQEALHAPAQLPTQETSAPTPEPVPVQQPAVAEKKREEKVESEPYQVVTIRKSVHRLLKMASVHYDLEIRELATEAIAAHPKIKEMLEKYG